MVEDVQKAIQLKIDISRLITKEKNIIYATYVRLSTLDLNPNIIQGYSLVQN